jgi:hypothetical protein
MQMNPGRREMLLCLVPLPIGILGGASIAWYRNTLGWPGTFLLLLCLFYAMIAYNQWLVRRNGMRKLRPNRFGHVLLVAGALTGAFAFFLAGNKTLFWACLLLALALLWYADELLPRSIPLYFSPPVMEELDRAEREARKKLRLVVRGKVAPEGTAREREEKVRQCLSRPGSGSRHEFEAHRNDLRHALEKKIFAYDHHVVCEFGDVRRIPLKELRTERQIVRHGIEIVRAIHAYHRRISPYPLPGVENLARHFFDVVAAAQTALSFFPKLSQERYANLREPAIEAILEKSSRP